MWNLQAASGDLDRKNYRRLRQVAGGGKQTVPEEEKRTSEVDFQFYREMQIMPLHDRTLTHS